MPLIASDADARRRSLADLSLLDTDDDSGQFSDLDRYLATTALLPRRAGLFGSGWARFMADRLGTGANPIEGESFRTPRAVAALQFGPERPANRQALGYREGLTLAAPAARSVATPVTPSTARSPLDLAGALRDFQNGPKIARPNLAESFIPVVGPAWEAVSDLQDRNYTGMGLNGLMAGADLVPIGVAAKGIRAASKGVGILKRGSVTAGAATKQLRRLGVAKKGEEVHHTVPLNGVGRSVQDWRNHYALLKVLPQEVHRRLHGSWNGKPMYDPVRRLWYGTTDWMKAVPLTATRYGADVFEHLADPISVPPPNPQRKPSR